MPWPTKGRTTPQPGRDGHILDGRRDVADVVARHGRGDARHHGRARRLDQSPGGVGHLAHDEGPRRIAVPAVDDGAGIDRDERPVAHDATGTRDAVHDLVVDRDAQRVAERPSRAGHADEGGRGPGSADDRLGDGIELEGRDARADRGRDRIEDVGHETAGDGHALDLGGALEGHATIVEGHLDGNLSVPAGRWPA